MKIRMQVIERGKGKKHQSRRESGIINAFKGGVVPSVHSQKGRIPIPPKEKSGLLHISKGLC